jgi:mRNA interferase HigB
VHVISKKALRDFWQKYPEAQEPLLRWYRIVNQTDFKSFVALKQTFPTADLVARHVVFNIGGNKYRLIASIHFNRNKLYIRHVLTHGEYDQGAWKK